MCVIACARSLPHSHIRNWSFKTSHLWLAAAVHRRSSEKLAFLITSTFLPRPGRIAISSSPPSDCGIYTLFTSPNNASHSRLEEQQQSRWFASLEPAPRRPLLRSCVPRPDPRFFVEPRRFRLATFTISLSTERRASPSSSPALTAVVGKYTQRWIAGIG